MHFLRDTLPRIVLLVVLAQAGCTPVFWERSQKVELDPAVALPDALVEVRRAETRRDPNIPEESVTRLEPGYYAIPVDATHELHIYPDGDSPFVLLVDLTTGQALRLPSAGWGKPIVTGPGYPPPPVASQPAQEQTP